MSSNISLLDLSTTHTLNAVYEAATTGKSLYVDRKNGSLVCSNWVSAFFDKHLRVANLSTVTSYVEKAFANTEKMILLHASQHEYAQSVYTMLSTALRAQQVFEAAKVTPSRNKAISDCAKSRQFHFLSTQVAIGLARITEPPKQFITAEGPYVINGKYYYNQAPQSFMKCLLHMGEMGISTQCERIKSLIGKILSLIVRLFGQKASFFSGAYFFPPTCTDRNIYDQHRVPLSLKPEDAERFSSFWIGHATCLYSIPVQGQSGNKSCINVITDPIEEDLSSLLYPRQTSPGRPLEECPPIHVCLITHNHQDHLSPKALAKLRAYDPLMIVPRGDAERIRSLGFSRVVEMGWFEKTTIEVKTQSGDAYQLGIASTPSNHGSGNLSQGRRNSLFNGYVIQSTGMDGDVYFAGDTARLNPNHLEAIRNNFSIRYNFQPGGPDENRSLNRTDHQASCDGIALHARLVLQKAFAYLTQKLKRAPSFQEFLDHSNKARTIYMHMKTYKLGNIHWNDTDDSVARILEWLATHDSWDIQNPLVNIPNYEREVLRELAEMANHSFILRNGSPLLPKQLAELLRTQIVIPKIGSLFVGT